MLFETTAIPELLGLGQSEAISTPSVTTSWTPSSPTMEPPLTYLPVKRSALSVVEAARVKLTHLEHQRASRRPSLSHINPDSHSGSATASPTLLPSSPGLTSRTSSKLAPTLLPTINNFSNSFSPSNSVLNSSFHSLSLSSPPSFHPVNSSSSPSSYHSRLYGASTGTALPTRDEGGEADHRVKFTRAKEWSEHAILSAARKQVEESSPSLGTSPQLARVRSQGSPMLAGSGSGNYSPSSRFVCSPVSPSSFYSSSTTSSSTLSPFLSKRPFSPATDEALYANKMAVQQSLVKLSASRPS